MNGFERMRVASGMFAAGWRLLDFRYVEVVEKLLHLHAASLKVPQKEQLMVLYADHGPSSA
jgi:hypothetical protein